MELPALSRDNNMGIVRYYLAFSVLISHFNTVFSTQFYWPTSSYNAVGGFFALSGFLVYGSYLKSAGIKQYLMRRARRIMPAYWFIVMLCAFGLCLVSDLVPSDYFFSSKWWRYVLSNLAFLNFLEPSLPGVFTDNQSAVVNASLWTMKIEWMLYLSVPLAAWIIARCRGRYVTVICTVYLLSMVYRIMFQYLYDTTGHEVYNILGRQVLGQLMYFYIGVLIRFRLDDFLRHRWIILAVILILMAVGDFIPYYTFTLSPVTVSALVIWLSVNGRWGVWAGNNDNVSYDIYLFHFPVEQLLFHFGINRMVGDMATLGLCVIITALLACFSWFVIGKRFLVKNARARS